MPSLYIRHPVPRYEGAALLPGWEQSEGARLERAVDEWIEEAI